MRNHQIILSLVIMIAALAFVGCDKNRDPGPITTEIYPATGFDQVKIASLGQVTLHHGTDFEVRIVTHVEVHREIEVEVVGSTLEIRYNENTSKIRIDQFDIEITAPLYTGVTLSGVADITGTDGIATSTLMVRTTGVGDITLRNIDVDMIDVVLDGVGDIELAGSATNSSMVMKDVGSIRAFDLLTDTCNARLTGVGEIRVSVTDLLDATLSGVGDIVYDGDPVLITDISGQGTVRQR